MSPIKRYSLDDLSTFVAVVDAGSFSAAANSLGTNKSAVSKQISRLELALQTRLLNRSTRRLSMTEVGQEAYLHALRIVEEASHVEMKVAKSQGKPTGLLRISTSTVFGNVHVAGMLSEFMERYPEVQVVLNVNDRYVNLAEDGFDVVLRMTKEVNLMSAIARPLARLRYALVASPSYLARYGAPATLDALSSHRCLTLNQRTTATQWDFFLDHKPVSIKVNSVLAINSSESLRICMLNGSGIALLPTFAVGRDIQSGHAVALLSEYQPAGFLGDYVYAMYLENRFLTPKVRVFIDYLIEKIGEKPYWDDY
jgi:DNA-binding transcriptional LysR family regulator